MKNGIFLVQNISEDLSHERRDRWNVLILGLISTEKLELPINLVTIRESLKWMTDFKNSFTRIYFNLSETIFWNRYSLLRTIEFVIMYTMQQELQNCTSLTFISLTLTYSQFSNYNPAFIPLQSTIIYKLFHQGENRIFESNLRVSVSFLRISKDG